MAVCFVKNNFLIDTLNNIFKRYTKTGVEVLKAIAYLLKPPRHPPLKKIDSKKCCSLQKILVIKLKIYLKLHGQFATINLTLYTEKDNI